MSSEAVRTSNQSRASTKIAIVFVAVVLAAYFGYRYWATRSVANMSFGPVPPTNVNLVGVDTSKGYYIIVANGIAQVIEGDVKDFESPGEQEGDKKRVPIKELLQTMQGNEEATSRFVMVINEVRDEDLPVARVYWDAADIKKALEGDSELRTKLENDLNTRLDGTPLPVLRPATLDTGIVVRLPIEVEVPSSEGEKTVSGTYLIPFESRFMVDVWTELKEKPEVTREQMAGYYAEVAGRLSEHPERKQDVAKALEAVINPEDLERRVRLAEDVVDSMEVLINSNHIESATYEGYDTARGKMFDIRLKLTDEGRNRLWKYSIGKVGSQILLTVDGVAIAAPQIGHELAQRDLTVRQILLDERLVKAAVDTINEAAGN